MSDKILELQEQKKKLLGDAEAIFSQDGVSAEECTTADKMYQEAKALTQRIEILLEIKEAGAAIAAQAQKGEVGDDRPIPGEFKTLGEWLTEVYSVTFGKKPNRRLKNFYDKSEPGNPAHDGQNGWMETKEQKDLLESIGASGGFLVPTEQPATLLQWDDTGDNTLVQSRATVIRMRRRAIQIPVLNQVGTTAGQPHWWGGVLAYWTEEAQYKDETEPSFKQIELVAHKLCCYTEASDELLEDSAISLEDLLRASFAGVTSWERQDAFINGTGAGQPLGVIPAPATITIPPVALNALAVADFVNMLEAFQGRNPVWFINRRWMSNLLQLQDPSGQYVFIPNAREGAPATLFGFPVFYVEQMPAPGVAGSVLLADWSKYLIGDRQAITIDSTKIYRFRYDITSWRAVSRVDGQPWLSLPLTLSDGTTQISPFVILGAVAAT